MERIWKKLNEWVLLMKQKCLPSQTSFKITWQSSEIVYLFLKFCNLSQTFHNFIIIFLSFNHRYLQWKKTSLWKNKWMSVFDEENMLTISNLLSSATVQGKTTVDPAWAKTLVLFFVAKILTAPKVTFGKNCWALLNNRLPSSVPSLYMKKKIKDLVFWITRLLNCCKIVPLFMNKCVSSTGGEIAVEVTLRLFAELKNIQS